MICLRPSQKPPSRAPALGYLYTLTLRICNLQPFRPIHDSDFTIRIFHISPLFRSPVSRAFNCRFALPFFEQSLPPFCARFDSAPVFASPSPPTSAFQTPNPPPCVKSQRPLPRRRLHELIPPSRSPPPFSRSPSQSSAMGGYADEFPLLSALGLYAADIRGDGMPAPLTCSTDLILIVLCRELPVQLPV